MSATDLHALLGDLFTTAEISEWLCEPSLLLDGKSPQDLIATGRGDEVIRLAHQIAEGVYF